MPIKTQTAKLQTVKLLQAILLCNGPLSVTSYATGRLNTLLTFNFALKQAKMNVEKVLRLTAPQRRNNLRRRANHAYHNFAL